LISFATPIFTAAHPTVSTAKGTQLTRIRRRPA
jgi:hypothetical protein